MLDWILPALREQLDLKVFSAGAALLIVGALMALLRDIPAKLWSLLQRTVITTIDVSDHDPAFFWIQKWLGDHPYTKNSSRLLTASTRTRPVNNRDDKPMDEYEPTRKKRQLTEVVFSPAPGAHLIRFKGHFILINRLRKEGESINGDIAYHETFEFRTFSREIVKDLIFEAREAAFPPEDNRIAVMKADYSSWRIAQRRPPRPAESVVLKDSMLTEIRDDLNWFFHAKDWYVDRGIPYQRGYLLYGPPGNGKSSLVVALASIFQRDIYILTLTSTSDNQLANLMACLPEHALVLIEDVDCIYEGRKAVNSSEDLTFSGFLNAIDGVCAAPGRVLFLSTNHVGKLDDALLRPGRIDRKFEFKNADKDMARRLYLRFFPHAHLMAEAFSSIVGDAKDHFSMATLQEHLIAHRDDPEGAVTNLVVPKRALVKSTNGTGCHVID